jgi:hypothetical protein
MITCLTKEERPPILPQPITHLFGRRLGCIPVLLRCHFLPQFLQRLAKPLLARLVEVIGGTLAQQHNRYLGNGKARQRLHDLWNVISNLHNNGFVEMQRWAWVSLLECVGNGPGIHHVGAIGEFDSRGAVFCIVAWAIGVVRLDSADVFILVLWFELR